MVDAKLVIEKLSARYAVKKFDATKKIADATWSAIEESLRLTPSSFGLQPWKFIVVRNAELRETLQGHSWNQNQITTASHLVVLAAKKNVTPADVQEYIAAISETRGVPAEALNQYRDMMLGFISQLDSTSMSAWTAKQAYIALGFVLETAALLDVDSCPMEGFDKATYNELLGLNNTDYTATVVCTLGYRAADDGTAAAKKVRYSHDRVIEYR